MGHGVASALPSWRLGHFFKSSGEEKRAVPRPSGPGSEDVVGMAALRLVFPGGGRGAPCVLFDKLAIILERSTCLREHANWLAGVCHMSYAPTTPSHGVLDAMFGLGEPRIADNDCMNTVVCCCYGIHHLIYYFISM